MAHWKAEIKLQNPGNYFPVTVEAGSVGEAKSNIQHIYSPMTIRNLHQVSRSSSSSSSDGDGSGAVALIGLIGAAYALFTFTPIVLMIVYGGLSTWISQFITGQTIEEYNEREDGAGHKRAAFVLALTLLAGGFGFVQGTQLQKEWNTPDTPTQVKPK